MWAWTLSYLALKLFSNIPNLVKNIPQRHGQTDRQTTCNLITALCVASRGKTTKTRQLGAHKIIRHDVKHRWIILKLETFYTHVWLIWLTCFINIIVILSVKKNKVFDLLQWVPRGPPPNSGDCKKFRLIPETLDRVSTAAVEPLICRGSYWLRGVSEVQASRRCAPVICNTDVISGA